MPLMGRWFAASAVAFVLAVPAAALGQESLAEARQLYASAEYHAALSMLNGLLAGSPPANERQSIELVRIFCLFAVDNVEGANGAIEEMIRRDPLYRPNTDEVPRRLRTAFTEARKRYLPTIIEQKYADAKIAFDKGDFKAASEGFTQVLMAMSDPDIGDAAQQRPLVDLRVLAAGFNELAVRSIAPPRAPDPPPPAPVAPPPVDLKKIYDATDANITAPVVVRQEFPPYSEPLPMRTQGIVEVIISETGAVESATMARGLHPRYDAMVMMTARTWRYQPATLDGVPVKFRKRIQITLPSNR
jgi:hypothetical protein